MTQEVVDISPQPLVPWSGAVQDLNAVGSEVRPQWDLCSLQVVLGGSYIVMLFVKKELSVAVVKHVLVGGIEITVEELLVEVVGVRKAAFAVNFGKVDLHSETGVWVQGDDLTEKSYCPHYQILTSGPPLLDPPHVAHGETSL